MQVELAREILKLVAFMLLVFVSLFLRKGRPPLSTTMDKEVLVLELIIRTVAPLCFIAAIGLFLSSAYRIMVMLVGLLF